MPRRLKILWAYVVELLAAGTTLLAICLWVGSATTISFVRNVALDTATLFGAVMLAASLGFLWTFFSKADTEFYRWLDARGAFCVYLSATAYSVAVSLLSTLSLVALKHIASDVFALLSTFAMILAIINLITLVRNVIDLMLLNTKFNNAHINN